MQIDPAHCMFKTSFCQQQKGFVAIFILVIVSLGVLGFMFNVMNVSAIKQLRIKQTGLALMQAKEALIGFSVGNDNMPGALPCPDITNDGVSDSCNASTSIGRLPWKTLGLSDLRDADSECLWYALSPVFRNTISTGARGSSINSPALNSTTAGSITVFNEKAVALPAPTNTVIAVIIAPGAALVGQSRANVGTPVCGGNTTALNYLDFSNFINNATGNKQGNNLSFIMGKVDRTFNDRLIYITQEDLYKPLRKRITREMLGNFGVVKGVFAYYLNSTPLPHYYPCPATTVTGAQDCAASSPPFYIPYADVSYPTLGAWLENNAWLPLTSYTYTTPPLTTAITLTVAGGASTATCMANNTNVVCN